MSKDNKFHGDFGVITEEEKDLIINPKHYKIMSPDDLKHFLDKGLEYLDIMRYALTRHTGVVAHVLGQVFKYSFRLGGKDDELQDATKIAWYGNRLVEEIEFKRGIRKEKPRGEFPKEGLSVMTDKEQLFDHLVQASAILEKYSHIENHDLDQAYQKIENACWCVVRFQGEFK